jgi:hypothetical protein
MLICIIIGVLGDDGLEAKLTDYHARRSALAGIEATVRVGSKVNGRDDWQYRIKVRWDRDRSRSEIEDLKGTGQSRTVARDVDTIVMNQHDINLTTGNRFGVVVSHPNDRDRGARHNLLDFDPRFLGLSDLGVMVFRKLPGSVSPLVPEFPKHSLRRDSDGAVRFETRNGATIAVRFDGDQVVELATSFQRLPGTSTVVKTQYRDWNGITFPKRVDRVSLHQKRVSSEIIEVESFFSGKAVEAKEVDLRSMGIERGRAVFIRGADRDAWEQHWDGEKIVVGSPTQPSPQSSVTPKAVKPPSGWTNHLATGAVVVGLFFVAIGIGRKFLMKPTGG